MKEGPGREKLEFVLGENSVTLKEVCIYVPENMDLFLSLRS